MLSYSRLFRPWDISNDKYEESCANKNIKTNQRKLINETKRENRLRRIRGNYKKTDPSNHQDATISTTTIDLDDFKEIPKKDDPHKENPVASLTSYCDSLLQKPKDKQIKKEKIAGPKSPHILPSENHFQPANIMPNLLPHPVEYNRIPQGYIPEFLPTDIAQTLGVTTTDPLLLESLAQGYAMELEYARIIQQENEAKLLNARKQRPKKYKCPHCQVGFSNNGQLKGHIRIHTGERPYKCDEKNCGKTFTRNEELTRHKRIHSGVRPFPCSTCGKKFGRRDHLKKHTRTHYLQAERMMPVFVPLSAVSHVGFPYLYGY